MKIPTRARFLGVLSAAAALAIVAISIPSADAVSSRATAPACTVSGTKVSFHPGQGAAGSVYGQIRVTNTSKATCMVRGHGGVSYVGYGDGGQVGAAADQTAAKVKTVSLKPGGTAHDQVRMVEEGNYSPRTCGPTDVDGFRVYLPGEVNAQFIAHRTIGCSNPKVHLLSVEPFRA